MNNINVKIRSFEAVAGTASHIVAQVYHAAGAKLLDSEVRAAIQDACGGKMVAVANSFQAQASTSQYNTTIQGMVEVAREAVPFTPEHVGFKSISGNMFMDESDAIWALRESDSGSGVLVRTNDVDTPEQITSLLSQCCVAPASSENKFLASCSSAMQSQSESVDTGNHVLAYLPDEAELVFGVAVANNFDEDGQDLNEIVLMRPDGTYQAVAKDLVAISVDVDDAPTLDQESVSGVSSGDRLLDYYSKLYANHPDFYAKLEKRIRAHTFC